MRISKWGAMVVLVSVVSLVAFGCSKKADQKTNLSALGLEGEDKDMVTQTVTSAEQEGQVAVQTAAQPIRVQANAPAAAPVQIQEPMESAPTQMPGEEMDRNRQIQIALKNANLYNGAIDGKIGPMTKKAIEEFQQMRGLKVDGKVGPVTWGELQKYLTGAVASTANEAVNNAVSNTASKTGR